MKPLRREKAQRREEAILCVCTEMSIFSIVAPEVLVYREAEKLIAEKSREVYNEAVWPFSTVKAVMM